MIDVSALYGLTLPLKQAVVLRHLLKSEPSMCVIDGDGLALVARDGARTHLTIAQAIERINVVVGEPPEPPSHEGLDMARGTLRVDDPISSFCYEGAPRGKRRIE